MSDASLWWAVAAGGSFGALVRAAVYGGLARRTQLHPERAWVGLGLARATLVVNLAGSFLLGLPATMLPMGTGHEPMRNGVLGVAAFSLGLAAH